MITGIYKIENNINGKVYIGQSVDIKNRWRGHIFDSFHKEAKDFNMVIHRAIRKYGKENFTFSIIEECNKDSLNDREIFWIDVYDSYNNGYNATKGGNNYDHSWKSVELYNYDGEYVKTLPSATAVAEFLNISRNVVYQVLHKQRRSCGGYQLKYKDDVEEIKPYKNRQGGKIPVLQLDNDFNIIQEYESSYDAARKLNLDPSCITKCCKGKLKTHGGYRWIYKE